MKENSSNIRALEARLKKYVPTTKYDETYHFYSEVLKLPVKHEWNDGSDGRGVMFDCGSIIIELIENNSKEALPISLSLLVKNVCNTWQELQSITVSSLQDRPWGDTDFSIRDPEGFTITFFSPTNLIRKTTSIS